MDALTIRKRFDAINQHKLERIGADLSARQRDALALLPMLLDQNHPKLPGFMADTDVPCGIQGYRPGDAALHVANQLVRGYQRPKQKRQPAFRALYLMGSSGSIAFNSNSDFDVWVCHDEAFDPATDALLRQKFAALERWADDINLELHFFSVVPKTFRDRVSSTLSKESSGSAQTLLLLDEFYRTGVLVAGAPPLWWLIPPRQEADHASAIESLTKNQSLEIRQYLDFGPFAEIPAEELYGAALWQVFKALDSPHKAILKIMLMEAYAAEQPAAVPLSRHFKELVLDGVDDLDRLDPYLLMYYKIEHHLENLDAQDRLDLARRCLYLKVDEKLSRPARVRSARRLVMETLVRDWGWSQSVLTRLDKHRQWGIDEVLADYRSVVRELSACYSRVARFSRSQVSATAIRDEDVNVLGRRVYAAFESRPGKVSLLHYPLPAGLAESVVAIKPGRTSEGRLVWELLRAAGSNRSAEKMRHFGSLWELLLWGALNGVLIPNTRFICATGVNHLKPRDLTLAVRHIYRWLSPAAARQVKLGDLKQLARPTDTALLVNFAAAGPAATDQKTGTPTTNGLSVARMWYAYRTTWGEVLWHEFVGGESLVGALRIFLNDNLSAGEPNLFCFAPSDVADSGFAAGVQGFFMAAHRAVTAPVAKFFLSARESGWLGAWRTENEVAVEHFADSAALLARLGEPCGEPRQFAIAPGSIAKSLLPLVLEQHRLGEIQVFVAVRGPRTIVYVVDELGSVYLQPTETFSIRAHMRHMQRFVAKVTSRLQLTTGAPRPLPCTFYRLWEAPGTGWCVKPVELMTNPLDDHFHDIQMLAGSPNSIEEDLVIRCAGAEFSATSSGPKVYELTARHILSLRRGAQTYPAYITDIDFTEYRLAGFGRTRPQFGHFLKCKQAIEQKLTHYIKVVGTKEGPRRLKTTG